MRVHTDWLLTAERVAIHLPTATAVAADLHLGYNDCRRRAGEAVPFADLDGQLKPLGKSLKKHGSRRLVIAGDLFEAGFLPDLMKEFQHWLADAGVELTALVPGNHDRGLDDSWPLYPQGFKLDSWRIVHGNAEIGPGPVVHGHVHPAVRCQGRKFPCFLVGRGRLVLPAYSKDAAGVNVAYDRTWQGFRCYAIRTAKVIDFGHQVKSSHSSQSS
ncbi:MAG TPA: metallophosphoesterase [Gemmataceae bacterium]|nr:metallophosphoesterase [Gemmataceae bacterium]